MDSLQELITELLAVPDMLVVIDSHGAVSEMHTRQNVTPEFKGKWATIESRDWHIHLNTESVSEVQFVEAEDRYHDDIPKLLYARLADRDDNTLIRFYFPSPWLDDDEKAADFQPEKLKQFEDFRDRYMGRPGVVTAQI